MNKDYAQRKSTMSDPVIEVTKPALPKGGGAIRGIGETFQPQEFSGTAALSIPIPTSPCRGFEPHLSVDYNSGAGSGIFGLGWSLSIPNISRKTSKGTPRYDGTDTFILSNAADLVPVEDGRRSATIGSGGYAVSAYRPRTEGLFAKIERWVAQDSGEAHWRVISKNNVTSIYGATPQTKICDPANPDRVFQWLLQETFDAKGNHALYEYASDSPADISNDLYEQNRVHSANRTIARIKYGNDRARSTEQWQKQTEGNTNGQDLPENTWHFEVVFDYGEHKADPDADKPHQPPNKSNPSPRLDPFSSYHAGFEIRTRRLCRRILMLHHFAELGSDPVLTHATHFNYRESPSLTLLESVEAVGYRLNNGRYETAKLPPLTFDYTPFEPASGTFTPFLTANHQFLPGVESPRYQLVDLYGEGLPGVLYGDGDTLLYWEPESSSAANGTAEIATISYAAARQPATFPVHRDLESADQRLMDLTGNGRLDLVVSSAGGAGYYQVKPDRSWAGLRALPAVPTDFRDPDSQLVDFTGDGLPDLVRIEHDHVQVYPGLGRDGFGPAQSKQRRHKLPWPAQSRRNEVVRFADMFGTGGQHLVRISSGQVKCWPHLGYGDFTEPVLFDSAPQLPAEFDAARLFLVDLDGSGSADIVYAHEDRVQIWFNQSGNSFSKKAVTRALPAPCTQTGQLSFADVLGTGTMALVFSDNRSRPRHWYLDLSQGRKAYLLNSIDNHLGATSTITYASSTEFYLADKRAGRPWLTRLPFPVQVVAKIETEDHFSAARLVRSYAYRHGYYDGEEREFRGFGMVERRDAETLSTSSKPTAVPPVVTRTWYHSGVSFDKGLASHYRPEYYDGGKKEPPLEDTLLEQWISDGGENLRHVHRALHGRILREEVYSEDANGIAGSHPYTVTESGFTARLIQDRSPQQAPILFVHPRETITYHYEQQADDPRVSHDFTLEVDKYGSTERHCQLFYPRRKTQVEQSKQPVLQDATTDSKSQVEHPEQHVLQAVATCSTFLNVDSEQQYLAAIPQETRSFEIGGLQPASDPYILTFQEARDAVAGALNDQKSFAEKLDPAGSQARLLSCKRTLYWNEDQTGILVSKADKPNRTLARALLHHVEEVAFPNATIAKRFGARVDNPDVLAQGGYVQRPIQIVKKVGDGPDTETEEIAHWWKLGSIHYYNNSEQFFLLRKTADPLKGGSEITYEQKGREISYDQYGLAAHEVTDPLGSKTSVETDYQMLKPFRVTDINGSVAEALFDPLGRVVATTVYGSENGQANGDKPLPEPQTGQEKEEEGQEVTAEIIARRQASQELVTRLTQPATLQKILADPHHYLQQATSRHFYFTNLSAEQEQQPPFSVTLQRETHVSDLPEAPAKTRSTTVEAEKSRIQIHIATFDGLGRAMQSKVKAGSSLAYRRNKQDKKVEKSVQERWLTSGRTVYNNKGKVVKQYEPFFSATAGYESEKELAKFGVTHVTHYDPLLRVIRVDTPDGFFSKVEFTPWQETHYDENDTVKESPFYLAHNGKVGLEAVGQDALDKAAKHAGTPETHTLDTQGRAFQVSQLLLAEGDKLVTEHQFDIQGRELASIDPRGIVSFEHAYDMTGTLLWTKSVDAGERWMLNNVMGHPIHIWDGRNFQISTRYDKLRRPLESHVQGDDGEGLKLDHIVEKMVYGETEVGAQEHNLRGKLLRHYDQAGLVHFDSYDIKGNLLKSSRQLRLEYKEEANWPETCEELLLEADPYVTEWARDALERVVCEVEPDGSKVRRSYHPQGPLQDIVVEFSDGRIERVVDNVDHNARGQRAAINYGNGVASTYKYDRQTFRLKSIKSVRSSAKKGGCLPTLSPAKLLRRTTKKNGRSPTLQAVNYAYDPVGNITCVRDASSKTVFTGQQKVEPHNDYTYDALYRLTTATGREHPALAGSEHHSVNAFKQSEFLNLNDKKQLRNYREEYTYDPSGNLKLIKHQTNRSSKSWQRRFKVATNSNRAADQDLAGKDTTLKDFFDAHGNQKELANTRELHWNYRDNIAKAIFISRDDGPADQEFYIYDHKGQRVRKVSERLKPWGTLEIVETIYLGGVEIRRVKQKKEDDLKTSSQRWSLLITDDHERFAIAHHWRTGKKEGQKQIRYQLGNHLGSGALELTAAAEIISYEEYFPYGGTALIAGKDKAEVKRKTHRYSGKERDDSTGLYYYGARYYAPWLGRWINPDPAGTVDGLNLYAFVTCNPITFIDHSGLVLENAPHNNPHQRPLSEAQRKANVQKTKEIVSEHRHHISPGAEKAARWAGRAATAADVVAAVPSPASPPAGVAASAAHAVAAYKLNKSANKLKPAARQHHRTQGDRSETITHESLKDQAAYASARADFRNQAFGAATSWVPWSGVGTGAKAVMRGATNQVGKERLADNLTGMLAHHPAMQSRLSGSATANDHGNTPPPAASGTPSLPTVPSSITASSASAATRHSPSHAAPDRSRQPTHFPRL